MGKPAITVAIAWRDVLAPMLIVAVLASGCSSVRLHSETREKQGQAAVKAGARSTSRLLQAERDNHARLLEAELASINKVVAVQREAEIRVLARKPIASFSTTTTPS